MDSDSKTTGSVGSLLSTLLNEITALVRGEAELAKAEMSEKTHQAMAGVAAIALAGAVLLGGFLTLLAAVVLLLNEVLPPETSPWISAVIVGAVVTLIGALMLKAGLSKVSAQGLMPNRTINSLRNDKALSKEHQRHVKEEVK
ncbi:phage holin family protein [Halomonas qinghailakensis]|uniref:Phage holin family protein n=1 Tax=Halomonas qinghailakensis TaxID=2937790 RepID=A0AA46TRN5_9GAMM|nr:MULTISPECIES: phage holin family protein [Halomonas]UYO75315.1 phage holin family protein [Halomonas sp. ZZQ-149]